MFAKLLFSLLICFSLTAVIIGQEDTDSSYVEETDPDTVISVDDEEWEEWNKWDKEWDDFEVNIFDKDFAGAPTISLRYGFSQVDLNKFSNSFADPRLIELKLGYTHQDETTESSDILDYSFKSGFVSNINTDLTDIASVSPDLESEMWRFGFGRSDGYGYKIGSSAIIPYHSGSMTWSRLNMKEFPSDSSGINTLGNFNKTFRFGTSMESGLRIQFLPVITLEAGYERSIIFPRHLFWKWAGSVVIESVGQWMLDEFIEEVLDSSPYAAPIVNLLLKSGLSYGLYELRQEKMNWPFNSAAPLTYDQFKVGLSFIF